MGLRRHFRHRRRRQRRRQRQRRQRCHCRLEGRVSSPVPGTAVILIADRATGVSVRRFTWPILRLPVLPLLLEVKAPLWSGSGWTVTVFACPGRHRRQQNDGVSTEGGGGSPIYSSLVAGGVRLCRRLAGRHGPQQTTGVRKGTAVGANVCRWWRRVPAALTTALAAAAAPALPPRLPCLPRSPLPSDVGCYGGGLDARYGAIKQLPSRSDDRRTQ